MNPRAISRLCYSSISFNQFLKKIVNLDIERKIDLDFVLVYKKEPNKSVYDTLLQSKRINLKHYLFKYGKEIKELDFKNQLKVQTYIRNRAFELEE